MGIEMFWQSQHLKSARVSISSFIFQNRSRPIREEQVLQFCFPDFGKRNLLTGERQREIDIEIEIEIERTSAA